MGLAPPVAHVGLMVHIAFEESTTNFEQVINLGRLVVQITRLTPPSRGGSPENTQEGPELPSGP